MRFFSRLVVLFLTVALMGCGVFSKASIVTPYGDEIKIEIALTPEDQAKGLMHREYLDANAGMLFVFPVATQKSFWMKNTLIPLDAVHIGPNKKIVDIITMDPCPAEETSCPLYHSKQKSQFVLEINAGRAQELGLKVGDQLFFNAPQHAEAQ